MKSSKALLVTLAIATCFGLSSCASLNGLSSQVQKSGPTNLFTGLPGQNGEILAVKFDDTRSAHPQKGVESADIVFVTQVEAGLTRLLAIYSSTYPELLGPVRSARISDIDILAQFGRVGFAYSGAQSKMRPILAASNVVNLSAERNSAKIFPEDPMRIAPYAMMLHPNLLLEKAEPLARPVEIGITHGDPSPSRRMINRVVIHWPNAKYQADWNSATKRFDLIHDGSPNLNSEGEQLGSPMMVIQMVAIRPSEFGDRFGGVTPKSDVVGTGRAYFLRDGSVTEAIWSRTTAQSPTRWTLPDGAPANFAKGQVWFFLTDKEPEFAYTNPEGTSGMRK